MPHFRNLLAASARSLPSFRGKGSLGVAVGKRLTDFSDTNDCITTVKMRDGSLMRIDVRSKTEQWAYWTGEYDADVISRLATCLQEHCTVFDVGANVGFYSIALGKNLAGLNGKLHAFEPVPSNYARLQECINLNQLESTITAHNIALGSEEGIIELYMATDNNASTGNAVVVKEKVITQDKLKGNATARITQLDSYVQEQGIESCHLIKIDIEGAEVMFLRGGGNFLGKTRPIIYGEFNPYWLKQFGHSFLDVVSIVKPWDYRLFKQQKGVRFTEVMQPEVGLADILLCPAETPNSVLSELGIVL